MMVFLGEYFFREEDYWWGPLYGMEHPTLER